MISLGDMFWSLNEVQGIYYISEVWDNCVTNCRYSRCLNILLLLNEQIFPTHVKGVAGSVATLINWFCSYAVTMVFNYMLLWSSTGNVSC